MDPEFQRAMTIVLGAGIIVVGIGTTALVIAFRSFGGKKPKLGLIAALVGFVFVCCALLLALSYAAQ